MKKTLIGALAITISGCASMTAHDQDEPIPFRTLAANSSDPTALQTHFLSIPYAGKTLNLRVGVQSPVDTPIADVIFVHGFADRLDNHDPLFRAWVQAGIRVISLDLPSHGEDSGTYNNLNNFSFKDLASLIAKVERETAPVISSRPLILAGWSVGALILVRMIQEQWTSELSRPVTGAIYFAPGIAIRKFPWTFGDGEGEVTVGTLTHDPHPPHIAPAHPESPFWSKLVFKFAPRLVTESFIAQQKAYPEGLRTLVFTAGNEEDTYAKTQAVREWIKDQNGVRHRKAIPKILTISCPHAMHEMDNELPAYGGVEVRETAAAYAKVLASGAENNELPEDPQTFGQVCTLAK